MIILMAPSHPFYWVCSWDQQETTEMTTGQNVFADFPNTLLFQIMAVDINAWTHVINLETLTYYYF